MEEKNGPVWADPSPGARWERREDFLDRIGACVESDEHWTRCVTAEGTVYHWAELFGWREGERPEVTQTFKVDRREWYRGRGSKSSKLLVPNGGGRCCLGFLARHLCAADDDIEDECSPEDARDVPWPADICDPGYDYRGVFHSSGNTELCNHLMDRNDDEELDDKAREADLKSAFAQIGWAVEFEG
jgi:hypothetical protein